MHAILEIAEIHLIPVVQASRVGSRRFSDMNEARRIGRNGKSHGILLLRVAQAYRGSHQGKIGQDRAGSAKKSALAIPSSDGPACSASCAG